MQNKFEKKFYDFNQYIKKDRFMSYFYQLKIIYQIMPKKVLEIGPGFNFIKKVINNDMDYITLDNNKNLSPDIHGSLLEIPLPDNSIDLILCCQVLEHLPFSNFEKALDEFHRITKKNILISLPYAGYYLNIIFNISFLKEKSLSIFIPKFFKKHNFNGQHYWEIGKKSYSLKKITNILKKKFKIIKQLHPIENKYHIFFLLEKKCDTKKQLNFNQESS